MQCLDEEEIKLVYIFLHLHCLIQRWEVKDYDPLYPKTEKYVSKILQG